MKAQDFSSLEKCPEECLPATSTTSSRFLVVASSVQLPTQFPGDRLQVHEIAEASSGALSEICNKQSMHFTLHLQYKCFQSFLALISPKAGHYHLAKICLANVQIRTPLRLKYIVNLISADSRVTDTC